MPHGGDRAGDLVARDEGERVAELAAHDVQVRATDAACGHADHHVALLRSGVCDGGYVDHVGAREEDGLHAATVVPIMAACPSGRSR